MVLKKWHPETSPADYDKATRCIICGSLRQPFKNRSIAWLVQNPYVHMWPARCVLSFGRPCFYCKTRVRAVMEIRLGRIFIKAIGSNQGRKRHFHCLTPCADKRSSQGTRSGCLATHPLGFDVAPTPL